MGLYPNTKPGKIGFFNSKIAPWTASATPIGTTSGAVTALQALVTAAQSALDDQIAAEQAVKTKTATADVAVAQMVVAGQNIIKDIRAKASNSADPNVVYNLAEIPAPATPTPVGDLTKASEFVVTLEETGELNLSFKASQPKSATGVTYQIWRKIDNAGTFECVGGCGSDKKFFDATVPAGSRSVTYKIQAQRSTSKSPWAQFVVNFGVELGTGGMTIASVVETPAGKIAA